MSEASRLVVPLSICRYVAERIESRWAAANRDAPPVVASLPESLPSGQVIELAVGGPFGWMLLARLDEEDGRLALEVLEDDRMSGPDHYRVWDDGTREQLDTESTTMALPPDCTPDEAARIEDDYYTHNQRVQASLRERGFI